MKHLYIIVILFLGCALYSCSGNNKSCHKAKKSAVIDKTSKEYTSTYICPMYCMGSGADKMGSCPACGMDYELNEEKAENQKEHDHSHDGHNHN